MNTENLSPTSSTPAQSPTGVSPKSISSTTPQTPSATNPAVGAAAQNTLGDQSLTGAATSTSSPSTIQAPVQHLTQADDIVEEVAKLPVEILEIFAAHEQVILDPIVSRMRAGGSISMREWGVVKSALDGKSETISEINRRLEELNLEITQIYRKLSLNQMSRIEATMKGNIDYALVHELEAESDSLRGKKDSLEEEQLSLQRRLDELEELEQLMKRYTHETP